MRFVSFAAICACLALTACGDWKSGQANSAQGNISQDNRPPATANSSGMTPENSSGNAMVMLAAPLSKDRALAVMHERHEGMETIGKATKAIHRALDSGDFATIGSNAAEVARLSQKASSWFARGTGPELGKTGAKPEIWQTPEDFAAKLRNFQGAAQAFSAAARGNDAASMKAKFADLGGTCKACHDKYRSEMHH